MNNGTVPIISIEAIICHNANRSEDEESIVKILSPERPPPPNKAININRSHHGTPLLRIGERPLRA